MKFPVYMESAHTFGERDLVAGQARSQVTHRVSMLRLERRHRRWRTTSYYVAAATAGAPNTSACLHGHQGLDRPTSGMLRAATESALCPKGLSGR